MKLTGQSHVQIINDKHLVKTTVLVSPEVNHSVLVGLEDLMLLRVVPASFPAVAATGATLSCFDKLKAKLLSSYMELFSNHLCKEPMKLSLIHI